MRERDRLTMEAYRRVNMKQRGTIQSLQTQNLELIADNVSLRMVLEGVEFVHPKYAGACPWCKEQPEDHADNCSRQAVLHTP